MINPDDLMQGAVYRQSEDITAFAYIFTNDAVVTGYVLVKAGSEWKANVEWDLVEDYPTLCYSLSLDTDQYSLSNIKPYVNGIGTVIEPILIVDKLEMLTYFEPATELSGNVSIQGVKA